MPLHIVIFYLFLLVACLYATWAGGLPERLVSAMVAVAALATSAVPFHPHRSFLAVEQSRLLIDLALMAGLLVIALRANRYWPIWAAALHLIALGVHGVRAYDPSVLPIVYAKLTGWMAYPIVLSLALGARRHRSREAQTGPEPSWSRLRWL